MIPIFNDISSVWYNYFMPSIWQNSLYIGIILICLYFFRNSNKRFLRLLAILGILKLLIPPVLIFPINTSFLGNRGSTVAAIDLITVRMATSDQQLLLQSWIMILWILPVLFLLTTIIVRTIRLNTTFKNAKEVDVTHFSDHPFINKVNFYLSEKNHSPFLVGLIKKSVILPKDWHLWDNSLKSAVITHELFHVQNRDHWLNFLKSIALCLNFFNPLVWLLCKRFSDLSEMVCDDKTVESLRSNGRKYTEQLVNLSVRIIQNKSAAAISLAFSESYTSLRNRITYQLSKNEGPTMKILNKKHLFLITAMFIGMLLFSWQCENREMAEVATASEEKIYRYDEVTTKPEIVDKALPEYPEDARKEGITGKVIVTVTIDDKGKVIGAELYKALNEPEDSDHGVGSGDLTKSATITSLDQAALAAAQRCLFKPAKFEGKNVHVKLNIPYQFALK